MTEPAPKALSKHDMTGVVLAGGRGSRMGGVDKGLQPLNLEPLAVHALRRLSPQCGAMLISANRSLEMYAQLGMPFRAKVIVDAFPDFPGPLAGMSAALHAAQTGFVLFAPCDAPFIDTHLAERLSEKLLAGNADIAVASVIDAAGDQHMHPVFALLRASLADDLDAFIRAGERKVRAWYARHKAVEVTFTNERAFYNVNDLQQLADLERN
ncbi:molybdopterin-guanine dinucleotide biosynthesis protein MobA [Caballeronia sordidicola]|uniref:Molybdenum cofactor guanylyltransferase n=1 Tax=Caballeronia sordidicola TaxID=196367 RepID=A0A158GI79_CABSO|nr:molybdenum cofactor guanylyltransferase MobA [Caballeronia sordidicola]SAL31623.1 molybdopterin-guanine dinucleotide biosynthesis protein MobA [Caballeronia sordidicola]